MDFEKNIKTLKLSLPHLTPLGLYLPAVKSGHSVITSGQLPMTDGRVNFAGRVGKEVSLENAQRAAKISVTNCLAAIKWAINDLNKIKKIVKMNAFINATMGFTDLAKISNAASDLLIQIFGDEVGAHARTTVGVLELPMGACVEIDLQVEIK